MELSPKQREALNNNPLYRNLGITLLEMGGGEALSQLRPQPDSCWPYADQPHGGVVFTLLDSTSAWAVISQLDAHQSCATISMGIHYIQRAHGEVFTCSAQLISHARRIAFARGEVREPGGGLIATSQGSFRIIKF